MTTPKLVINQKKRKKSRNKLYLCTIYPDIITPEMMFNTVHLQRSERIELEPIFIKAGTFSHRHKRDTPDVEQIQIRQQYLDKVPDGEWLLVLDSDELILAPPDNLADMLDYLNTNDMEVGMIIEFRSDGDLKGRPRLIKKKAGLKYGGPNQKHDYIHTCDCYNKDHRNVPCGSGYNYIDVKNNKTAMDLPFYFYHVKTAGQFLFKHNEGDSVKHPDWVTEIDLSGYFDSKITGEIEQ